MQAHVKIRQATAHDSSDIAKLLEDLGYPTSELDYRKRQANLTSLGYHMLVASVNRNVIGIICGKKLEIFTQSKPAGWILGLVVNAESRRQRIGSMLIQEMESVFRREGVSDIFLHSRSENAEAHAFYRHHGYRDTAFRFTKVLT